MMRELGVKICLVIWIIKEAVVAICLTGRSSMMIEVVSADLAASWLLWLPRARLRCHPGSPCCLPCLPRPSGLGLP